MGFDFPFPAVDGQNFLPPGAPDTLFTFMSPAWMRSDSSNSLFWNSRADLVSAIFNGFRPIPGRIYVAGGYMYLAVDGSTAITDLPGLEPFGDVHVEHFGAVADMEWDLVPFTQSTTFQTAGAYLAPWRLSGTDQRAKFEAADDYVTYIAPEKGRFYVDGSIPGVSKSGYFLEGQFKLKSLMVSRRNFRNYIWSRNVNVYHSNIFIDTGFADPYDYANHFRQRVRGAGGFIIIAQYAYPSGVAKPFGHGCIGNAITIGSVAAPTGGAAIGIRQPDVVPDLPLSNTHVPFSTDVFIDVRFCRAGNGVRVGFPGVSQISRASYLFFGVGGIEHCAFRLGIREQTNVTSNGLGICHWNLMYDPSAGGDPLTNYSGMIPTETFHCCNTKVEIADEINMFDQPHGFQCVWEFASAGHVEVGPISCAGCSPCSISPGDLINHYTNKAQKEKIMKGIKVGKINGVDVAIGGDTMTPYANGAGANVYLRGFGTSKFDNDIFETTLTRNVCRQIEVDVAYEGISLTRTGRNGFVPRWNGRAFYAQGCQGKLYLGALTTFGIGRGYEIEYCDGDQQLNYVEGDGCLLYEFSRGGRLLQTDTNRIVEGYVENVNDGSYRPGAGPGTRAISIGGGTYSTVVDTTLGPDRVNTTTKTYIVPFGGADDDVYRGTPIQIGTQWVTATEFIQGRTGGGTGVITETGVAITNITQANPAVFTSPGNAFPPGTWVIITAVQGMTQVNGQEGKLIYLDENTFSIENLDSTTFSAYTGGGTVTQKLPTRPFASITPGNPTVFVTTVPHEFAPNQYVGVYNVVGMSLVTPGTPYTVTRISRGNPAVVTVNLADLKQFANNMEVTIAGADATHSAANGRHVIAGLNLTNRTFQLVGVNTLSAAGDQTIGTMTAAPHKSGINGKSAKVTFISETSFSLPINTLSPALTPYISGGGAMQNYEGVGFIMHTPLRVPAVNGQKVTVDEFCRVKQGSITSRGGETGVVLSSGGIDTCDMHGLRSAGKYGANMVNGRITLKGPLPLTVGVTDALDNYTIKGDGRSLFSMSDGSVLDNPFVNYHFYMAKDTATGATGHVELRNCRIANIAKLMEGNNSKLRFALSMYGCTDTQINQLLSHPARQGGPGSADYPGSLGYFNFSDDGKLQCWVRGLVTVADPVDAVSRVTWTFPAAFNGGGATVSITANIQSAIGAVRAVRVLSGSSTSVTFEVVGGPVGDTVSLNADAIGRWYPE